MDRSLNEENINSKKIIKHSALGISAFVLSIFTLLFVMLLFIIAYSNAGKSSSGESSPTIGVIIIFMCAIPSTVLAIVDLTQSNRKKVLPIWALIFNWGWLVLTIIGTIVGVIIYNSYIS